MGKVICVHLALLMGIALQGQTWKTYPYEPAGSLIGFPRDEGRHPDTEVEWWYMSGHLEGQESGTSYSFMISYFFFQAAGFDGFRILNISEDQTGEFFSDVQGLVWNAEKCTHCGHCLTVCPTGALHIKDPATREVSFNAEECVECLACIPGCPYNSCTAAY